MTASSLPAQRRETVVTLTVTGEQQQALAECVAAVVATPGLSKRSEAFLMNLWADVALDETLEG